MPIKPFVFLFSKNLSHLISLDLVLLPYVHNSVQNQQLAIGNFENISSMVVAEGMTRSYYDVQTVHFWWVVYRHRSGRLWWGRVQNHPFIVKKCTRPVCERLVHKTRSGWTNHSKGNGHPTGTSHKHNLPFYRLQTFYRPIFDFTPKRSKTPQQEIIQLTIWCSAPLVSRGMKVGLATET